jgi:hypothetical protein
MTRCFYAFILVCTTLAGVTATPQVAAAQAVAAAKVAPASIASAEFGKPFQHLFQDVVTDLRSLPSVDTATILSLGAIGAVIGHSVDRRVTRRMTGSTGLRTAFGAGEMLGSARGQAGGALAIYTIGRVTGSAKATHLGADLIRAQIVAQTMTAGVKMAIRRTRPDGTQYSFPSGHSSVAFATATVLQRNLGWKAGLPAYGAAAYVAVSRVQVKRHFLSDVAFGAAVGIVAGRTVTVGRGKATFALSPAATPGGAGINLTWTGKN